MVQSSNEVKHRTGNPLLRFALERFFNTMTAMLPSVDSILDAGCGEGYAASRILAQHPQAKIVGVDLSFEAVQQVAAVSPETPACVADVTRLPVGANSFDMVISLEVLEHLPDPAAAIHAYRAVSRRYVFVSVPNEPLFRGLRMLRGDNLSQWGNHPEHINHWNLMTIQRFLRDNGLQVLRAASPPPFIWSMVLCEK